MAERVGFEPTVPLITAHSISSRAPSTGLGHLSTFFIIVRKVNCTANYTTARSFCKGGIIHAHPKILLIVIHVVSRLPIIPLANSIADGG